MIDNTPRDRHRLVREGFAATGDPVYAAFKAAVIHFTRA